MTDRNDESVGLEVVSEGGRSAPNRKHDEIEPGSLEELQCRKEHGRS
jgi:hypothetical protein